MANGMNRTSAPKGANWLLAGAFFLGLTSRLALFPATTDLGPRIVDEQHYVQLARTLAAGYGFGWAPGEPTSLRPPLYPGLVAGLWAATGSENLQLVRAAQIVMSMATAWLVCLLGRRVYGPAVGAGAAAIVWIYPSFIFFNFLILTETLFTFLLVAFVLLTVVLVDDDSGAPSSRAGATVRARQARGWGPAQVRNALACGGVLGLGALARSVLWPLPILLCPLLILLLRGPLVRRLATSALVFAGFSVVVGPWAVRNTRLQGVTTIVDTMGGMNLRMGNYEHTLDDRMWDTVALTGERNWAHGIEADFPPGHTITEGDKDKWGQRKALEYMRAHPAQTLRRALIKFADFWGLEREFIAGVQGGLFDVPLWLALPAAVAIILGYMAVAVLGAAGIWLAPPRDWRLHVLLLLPVLLITGLHTVVFGHSRYHVPLIPILAIYAAALVTTPAGSPARASRMAVAGAAGSVLVLVAIWLRQVVLVDLQRILNVIG
jgi:4-amino-4-deoxy-L-arabinose transferase-like glycosyltransferase